MNKTDLARPWVVAILAVLLLSISLLAERLPATIVCTSLGTLTTTLQLCKPATGETGWDAAINNNFTVLDSLFSTGNLLKPLNGGTGLNTSASTGIPRVNAGTWTVTAMTNGQVVIGSTGAVPVIGSITGTANQIVVTPGAGTITLSTPQNIATTSDVQFNSTLQRISRVTQATKPTCLDRLDASICTNTAGSDTAFTFAIAPGIAAGTRTLKVTFNVPFAAAPACVASWNGSAAYGYYVYAVAAQTTTAFISLGGASEGLATAVPTPSWGPFDQGSLLCFGVQ